MENDIKYIVKEEYDEERNVKQQCAPDSVCLPGR
jgi:hypothetical protein